MLKTLNKIYNESLAMDNQDIDRNKVKNDIIKFATSLCDARIAKIQSAGKLVAGKKIKFNEERFAGRSTTNQTLKSIEKKHGFRFQDEHDPTYQDNGWRVIQPVDWKNIENMIEMYYNKNGWSNTHITMDVTDHETFFIMFEGVYNG